jgi:TolB-like protein
MLRAVIVSSLMGALVLTGSVAASAPAGAAGKPGEAATTTLAVLYFDYAGRDPGLEALSKGLAQMLISDLAAAEVARVVERDRLQALLNEQKLAASGKVGKFDSATAARVGKLLGARYLVMGSYFDLLGALRADARLVNVETGQIIKSVGATGPPGDFLGMEQILVKGLLEAVKTLPRLGPAPGPGGDGPRTPKPPRRLMTKTAVAYGRALAAADGGDKKTARALLTDVLTDQPDFALARRDLDNLVQ